MRRHKVNILAVVIAAVVHFAFGAAWFTFFRNPWMNGLRMSPAEMAAASSAPSPAPYLIALLANFGMAVVLYRLIHEGGQSGVFRGLRIGLMCGFGIAALPMLTEMFFEMRHLHFAMIAAGYPAIGSVLMGGIVGAFKARPEEGEAPRGAAAGTLK